MKNYINYFYGLTIDNLIFSNEKYTFFNNEDLYILKYCSDSNYDYRYLCSMLEKYKYFSNVVLNKNNDVVTLIDNKPFILLKVNNKLSVDKKIEISDIRIDMFIHMDDKLIKLKRFPWVDFWERKIDYLEDWIINKVDLYKKIYPIFNYFIGLSENALFYLKETIVSEKMENCDRLTIQHARVTNNTYLYEYYDPTNVVFDHSSRDVSEYFKSLWEKGMFDYALFEKYLDKINVSRFWIKTMYSRLLFPSFFFDYFEDSIIKKNNSDLSYLETKINDFQIFFSKISILLSKKYNIECLKWIINSN